MSEYQYYEFLALDRPLTEKQRSELRSISTRAEITATRFVNEYQWGDLKGDPRTMVERYFDAFLYLANWGTRRLMFRLPRGVLDPETAGQYCCSDTASLIETGSHLILSLYVDREPDDYWEEPGGQLAAMVQARSELAAGDLRLLYLAWLLALQSDEVDDEDTEPPVPAGLGNLSASLQAVVDFFEIDEDLIAVAAASSPSIQEPAGWRSGSRPFRRRRRTRCWRGSRPGRARRSRRCCCAASGRPAVHRRRHRPGRPLSCGRRLATARPTRAKAAEQRRREAEARRAAAQAAAYTKHLDQLAPQTEAAWEKAAELIETRRPRDYDLAASLLRDLQALADRQEDSAAFRKRFGELRSQHQRKPSLLDRFDQVGPAQLTISRPSSSAPLRTR